jgi:hypothetical protein
MYLLPLALAAIGMMFDLLSVVALLVTLVRKRWSSGFPGVPVLFYLPAAILAIVGFHPPRFSLTEVLLFLGALTVLHVLIHWWHGKLRDKLQGADR